MGQSHRTLKVADRIKVVVANLLETKIKDPRLGFVTVTDARVTGDLQQASIFYTVLGELGLRITPSIEFFEDGLPESAKALDSLLEKVHEQDAQVAALRKNAQYAGGEDPYKAPRIIED
jgi:ribosome-binding factor A